MTSTIQTFDWAAFRRAYERFDSDGVREMASPDIVCTEIDSRTPPSSPHVINGVEELIQIVDHVAGLGLELRVLDEIVSGNKAAFSTECRYPDGKKVRAIFMAHAEGGLITRMTEVQAFDE